MVMRVTNQLTQRNALTNIFRITEELFRTQQEIASGHRINKLSDDPAGVRDSLELKTSIEETRQFNRNIDFNRLFINTGDAVLGGVTNNLVRARELAIDQLGADSNAETRQFAKAEIEQIIASTLQEANTTVNNQFIFGGTNNRTSPFNITASDEIQYFGNSRRFEVPISRGFNLAVNRAGSEVFVADLNPALTGSVALADLNGGNGAAAGSFAITDRSGASATITVSAGNTVNDVIAAINGAGINVTASIAANGQGLQLTDSSGVINGALTVTEAGGTTAADLGILGRRDGNFTGLDLNARATASTLIADLNGGAGLSLGDINVVNGAASGTISLGSATTVGDVLNLINGSGFNVTASLNSLGNGLNAVSNSASSVVVFSDPTGGTTASDLGIGGGKNIFTTLITLKEALDKNDQFALTALLDNLKEGETTLGEGRAGLGGVFRRMEDAQEFHDQDEVDLNEQLSNIMDTDLVESASNLAQLEIALNATLSSTARIIQPSLLNFLQ